jgi:predicted GTPase
VNGGGSGDSPASPRRRIVILGAGGRDFHNFNTVYRNDPAVEVVAFGATQIPGIAGRTYPATLAGPLYPDGVPILEEDALPAYCRENGVAEAVFAYSDVTNETVMHLASRFLAAGCDFSLLGPDTTMIRSSKPVIAVTAVRTGCGKSPVSRRIAARLAALGLRAAVLRHPMPYGDLARQDVQRFATFADLDAADCTIEEREEYEPYVAANAVIYAGVDYARILARAEAEADIVLWDGGNNDFPFIRPDLHIALTDALRPGDETRYHPGETVLRMADIVLISKVSGATAGAVEGIERAIRAANPGAGVLHGDLEVTLSDAAAVRGRRVLVVEDGPTITHGGMAYGAGYVAAKGAGAAEIIDPRPYAAPEIAKTYARYDHIGPVLPAVGYYAAQIEGLTATIAAAKPDVVVVATPIRLERLIAIDRPVVHATYAYADRGRPRLDDIIDRFCARVRAGRGER